MLLKNDSLPGISHLYYTLIRCIFNLCRLSSILIGRFTFYNYSRKCASDVQGFWVEKIEINKYSVPTGVKWKKRRVRKPIFSV